MIKFLSLVWNTTAVSHIIQVTDSYNCPVQQDERAVSTEAWVADDTVWCDDAGVTASAIYDWAFFFFSKICFGVFYVTLRAVIALHWKL